MKQNNCSLMFETQRRSESYQSALVSFRQHPLSMKWNVPTRAVSRRDDGTLLSPAGPQGPGRLLAPHSHLSTSRGSTDLLSSSSSLQLCSADSTSSRLSLQVRPPGGGGGETALSTPPSHASANKGAPVPRSEHLYWCSSPCAGGSTPSITYLNVDTDKNMCVFVSHTLSIPPSLVPPPSVCLLPRLSPSRAWSSVTPLPPEAVEPQLSAQGLKWPQSLFKSLFGQLSIFLQLRVFKDLKRSFIEVTFTYFLLAPFIKPPHEV